jgi:hypothetical protein
MGVLGATKSSVSHPKKKIKNIGGKPLNWTPYLRASIHDYTSLPMCLFVHGTIDLDPCNI